MTPRVTSTQFVDLHATEQGGANDHRLPGPPPDILEVIANLSNDQVFTPPRVVNAVLDLFPPKLEGFDVAWLDPGCKTGMFPREITKRLMVGFTDSR